MWGQPPSAVQSSALEGAGMLNYCCSDYAFAFRRACFTPAAIPRSTARP